MGSQIALTARVGRVCLQVAALERALAFYQGLLGLQVVPLGGNEPWEQSDGRPRRLTLAVPESGRELVILEERPGARPRPVRASGLYHYALRLPHRRSLSQAVWQLARHGWPFEGFSDHGVSEAVYLRDPDGNGLELYVDRPREQWREVGEEVVMHTLPLDVEALLREVGLEPGNWQGLHPETVIGHIHLHVSDLGAAERFYADLLGLQVRNRSYPGALFLAAGGYHHHVAVNTWAGIGVPAPPTDAVGLRFFEWVVPAANEWPALAGRLQQAGLHAEELPEGLLLQDPDGIRVLLVRSN